MRHYSQNVSVSDLQLTGNETVHIDWDGGLSPGQVVTLMIRGSSIKQRIFSVIVRIDNGRELKYFLSGGVLNYVTSHNVDRLNRYKI
ncbi:hypothetical protein [Planctobacterium marinum]|uniref:Uncharacterized protein n=1 Tax=Planctobacterium marinum TaxID=1631968 RepID=A0AA48KR20_9ALTE|nr:hypothetical protein MACH26_05200 [Planctobacterium marinum]